MSWRPLVTDEAERARYLAIADDIAVAVAAWQASRSIDDDLGGDALADAVVAIGSCAGRADDADLARLAAQVVAGTVPSGDDGTLVRALAPGAGRIAGVAEALRVIQARHPDDHQLRAQISALLG